MTGPGSDSRRWKAYYFGLPPSPEMLRGLVIIYIVSFWLIGDLVTEQERLADALYAFLCLSLAVIYYIHVRSYYRVPPGPIIFENGILSIPAPLVNDRLARKIAIQDIKQVVLRTYRGCPFLIEFHTGGQKQFTVNTSSMMRSPDFGKFLASVVEDTEKKPFSNKKIIFYIFVLFLVILSPVLIPDVIDYDWK